jgi:protein-disulfide isomerase
LFTIPVIFVVSVFFLLLVVGMFHKPRYAPISANNQEVSQISNPEQKGIPQLGLNGNEGQPQPQQQPVQPVGPLTADSRTETVLGHSTDVYNRVFVFSDPFCPFCKKLEPMLEELSKNGYEVHIFPTPVHKESIPMINALACANDKLKSSDDAGRAKNWKAEINDNITPLDDCNEPDTPSDVEPTADASQKAYRFFAQFGFNATPTIVNGYGLSHSGTFNNENELVQFMSQKPVQAQRGAYQ